MVFDEKTMLLNRKNDYSWGNYKFNKNPNLVGAIVEQIEEEQGTVTSAALLEVARDSNSCIHDLFEWNDSIAAEKYRLDTSRHIINGLRVVVRLSDDKEEKVSGWVSVKVESKKERTEYVNVITALSDKEKKDIVLSRMYKDMQVFISRYSLYLEAVPVIEEMKKLIEHS